MVATMAEKVLGIADAAAYLGVSISSLRRWADRGEIKAARLPGGTRRFERGELDRWKRAHGFSVETEQQGGEE